MSKKTVQLTARQDQAFEHLVALQQLRTRILYGGAKGGGKSFLLCVWVVYWVKWLIRFFGLQPSDNPIPLGFMGRMRAVDFEKTTFETFKKEIPPETYVVHQQKKELVIDGTAKVWFGGLDDQININKFNSAELAFIALDQAEETLRANVSVLRASLRLTYNGKVPPYKELYTANPADCWLKEDYVDGKQSGGIYVPALPSDNPYLPADYEQTLADIFAYDPDLLKAYRDGDWSIMASTKALITSGMLEALQGVLYDPLWKKRLVAIDPALDGDECVIMGFENRRVIEVKILHTRDTMIIAQEAAAMANRIGANVVGGDAIGLGKGVFDRIRQIYPKETGIQVIEINSAEASGNPDYIGNRKAELWKFAALEIRAGDCPYVEDEETRRQLYSVHYKIISSNGKFIMEPKKETKKRLGRSPDRADCWIYGIWLDQFATDLNLGRPVNKANDYNRGGRTVDFMAA